MWNNTNGINEKDTIKRYSSSRFIKLAIYSEKNNKSKVKIIAAEVTIATDLKKSLLIIVWSVSLVHSNKLETLWELEGEVLFQEN